MQDVTEQWVDLDARLRTLQATEQELLALLAESRKRGQKLQDIMAVYRELTGIRSQIEQLEGQLKSLDQLAALSAIDVTLRPEESARSRSWRKGWRPRRLDAPSFRMLVSALTGIANLAIFLAIHGAADRGADRRAGVLAGCGGRGAGSQRRPGRFFHWLKSPLPLVECGSSRRVGRCEGTGGEAPKSQGLAVRVDREEGAP